MPIQNTIQEPINQHINEDKQTLRSQGWDIDQLITDLSDLEPDGVPLFKEKGQFLLCKALLGVPQSDVLLIWVTELNYAENDFRPTISDTVGARLRLMYNLKRVYFSRIRDYCINYLRPVIRIEVPIAMTTEKNQLVTFLQQTYPNRQVTVTQTITHFQIFAF